MQCGTFCDDFVLLTWIKAVRKDMDKLPVTIEVTLYRNDHRRKIHTAVPEWLFVFLMVIVGIKLDGYAYLYSCHLEI